MKGVLPVRRTERFRCCLCKPGASACGCCCLVPGCLMLATIAPLELNPLAPKDGFSWRQAGGVPTAGL